jgi:hypothetical protein
MAAMLREECKVRGQLTDKFCMAPVGSCESGGANSMRNQLFLYPKHALHFLDKLNVLLVPINKPRVLFVLGKCRLQHHLARDTVSSDHTQREVLSSSCDAAALCDWPQCFSTNTRFQIKLAVKFIMKFPKTTASS